MSEDLDKRNVSHTKQQKKDGNLDPISKTPGAHPVGTGAGAAVGGAAGIAGGIAASAATGLATGTVLGGPVGAVAGLVVGAVVGGLAGKAVAEQIDPTAEDAYWRNEHPKQPYAESGAYDQFGPAYRAGYEGRRQHAGKTYDEAERDLETHYDSIKGDSTMDWEHARPATRSAWDRVSGNSAQPKHPL